MRVASSSGPIPASNGILRLTIGFLLLRGFTLCAFANFVDVLRLAADDGDRNPGRRWQWRVLSPDMKAVYSSCGVAVHPHEEIADIRRFDYIVVVGGIPDDGTMREETALFPYLRNAAAAGIPLAGLSAGALALHLAGVMDGYRCCTSGSPEGDSLLRLNGCEPITDRVFVVDRDRLTCSEGVGAAHLAAFLVERHFGRAVAEKSLRTIVPCSPPDKQTPHLADAWDLSTEDPVVKGALLLMRQNLDTPLSLDEIVSRLHVNRRRLERRFNEQLGMSPYAAYTKVRLQHARHLLAASEKSVAAIAVECGYCDAAHLGRIFRHQFGVSPHGFRQGLVNFAERPET